QGVRKTHDARVKNRLFKVIILITTAMTFLGSDLLNAAETEGCLLCHRYRGLSRLDSDTGELRLFFCSAEYYTYQMGPHARLKCTDCHERSEVSIFPHKVSKPVDCTTVCHLEASGRLERRFSHRDVMDYLQSSVHSIENLSQLPFQTPLLDKGQSICLYCHDEPLFRYIPEKPGVKTTLRCKTCHKDEVPLDMEYFIRHTASRMQPARPVRQMVQVCAVCHSDPSFIEKYNTHDTVASYLHSFHGKSNLLGNNETATCLDCHASETGNIHAMLTRDDPTSTTHMSQLSDTCISANCHASAPPALKTAAVHLQLDPHARTPEFYVAAFFVIITAGTLSLFFTIIMLELLSLTVRRATPEEHRLEELARQVQAHPKGKVMIHRLTVHQRFQHWLLAITFTGLVYTGMCIKFADTSWAENLVHFIGGLSIARTIHRLCGVTMLLGLGYHLIYVTVHFICLRRKLRREGDKQTLIQTILNAPMMITLQDFKDILTHFSYLFMLRKDRPAFKRFGFMEKFEYWAVFWGCAMIGTSGAMLWATDWTSGFLSGRALNFAYIVHSDEAYLAFVYIAVIHLFSVIFSPVVFPLSFGSLSGNAPPAELAEKHSAHVEQIARQLDIIVDHPPARSKMTKKQITRQIVRRGYSVVLLAVLIMIWVSSLTFLLSHLFHRQTAPTEILEIPKRLDAKTLEAAPHSLAQANASVAPMTRGPLAHFHQIPPWFQSDPTNSCTTSGCHTRLPHGKRVETRAFLNMHTTIMDCGVCHSTRTTQSLPTAWYKLESGATCETPAVLRLASFFETTDVTDPAMFSTYSKMIIELLRDALEEAGDNEQLKGWLVHLETTNPQAKLWRDVVADISKGIQMHLHGEYNAKIAIVGRDNHRPVPSAKQQLAIDRYLKYKEKQPVKQSDAQKKSLQDDVHQNVMPVGKLCKACHNSNLPMLDFSALGYSPKRIDFLQNSPIARKMQELPAGEVFHIYSHPEGEK
ncbi:MAG: cytochrome b/b6 domain-containing protein, partial [Phycisphaerae bacterium]|nr:cytochrome b/b6 domain-containing protein [Phycisphaerae bacterium]